MENYDYNTWRIYVNTKDNFYVLYNPNTRELEKSPFKGKFMPIHVEEFIKEEEFSV